jgi:predicted nucleotidyltransferase
VSLTTEANVSTISAGVRSALGALISDREEVKAFIKFLAGFGKVVVFGGFVRDAIHNTLHADKQSFRDLDLVVVGTFGNGKDGPRNNFGGYRKLFADGLKIDYWTLDSTYAFSHALVLVKPSLETLALTTVFAINACVFDPATSTLHENGAISAISERRISFNYKGYLDLFRAYQAFRAVDFAERLRYRLDEEVSAFVRDTLSATTLPEFIRSVQSHRPNISERRLAEIHQCRGVTSPS